MEYDPSLWIITRLATRCGGRTTLVWIAPLPAGSAGWRHEGYHQKGPWPLTHDEKAHLEEWFEVFAREHWPNRVLVFPVDYRP